jgi:hypothetical protein
MRLLKPPNSLSFLPSSLSLSAALSAGWVSKTATSNAHQCQHLAPAIR